MFNVKPEMQGGNSASREDTSCRVPARLNLPGIPQHVTQRGNNRQACFFSADDYRLYLDLLSAACHKHDCALPLIID
jgi:hypothetical protein